MTATASPERDLRADAKSSLLAHNWWAVALRGVFAILFGVIAIITPTAAMLSLVLVFGAYMLIDGVLAIVSAIRAARRHERWGMLVLQGIVNLAAAAVAFVLPGITVLTFVLLMAAWAIVSGVMGLVATFSLRGDHGRWWLGFSSLLSILGGVFLILAPLLGALVLTWWLAAYAIIYGASMLILSYRLRAHREDRAHAGLTAHPA